MDWLTGLAATDIGFVTGLVAASLLGSMLALAIAGAVARRKRSRRRELIRGVDADIAFLFDDEALIDASPQARQFLRAAPSGGSDWSRLMMLMLPRFPEIEERIGRLISDERQEYELVDETTRLVAEWRHGFVRLTLEDLETAPGLSGLDRHGMKAMERELVTLRQVVEHTPSLIWRQGPRGQVTWANRAYFDMVERVKGREDMGTWPPPVLFEPQTLMRRVDGRDDGVTRISLTLPGTERKLWFDCLSHELEDGALFIALDVNKIVHAEDQLREFMQTLTKTFAHLTIGLAIFDRSRHLALFNPALTDLTQLPIDFLAARPTLFGFLDRLREKKMIPEPKDYKGWRKRLLELEVGRGGGHLRRDLGAAVWPDLPRHRAAASRRRRRVSVREHLGRDLADAAIPRRAGDGSGGDRQPRRGGGGVLLRRRAGDDQQGVRRALGRRSRHVAARHRRHGRDAHLVGPLLADAGLGRDPRLHRPHARTQPVDRPCPAARRPRSFDPRRAACRRCDARRVRAGGSGRARRH